MIQYVSGGYYTIASCADNSLYLKAVSDSEVKLASATQLSASADDSMLWAVLKNSDGSYRISPKAYPNKAAVVIGALTISGADVILFDDNMTRNGWWRLKCEAIDSAEIMQIESGSYYLQNEYSGKYMFMGGSSYNDVVQTGNHDNFPWSISCDNDGCFTISINYKLLRYVAAEGEEAYVDVVLNTTGQHDNIEEKWFMDRDARIHSAKYPNKVLAIENDSKDGGAYVVLADIETHQSESWMFLKAN